MYKDNSLKPCQYSSNNESWMNSPEYKARRSKKRRMKKRLEKLAAEHASKARLKEQNEAVLNEFFGVDPKPSTDVLDLLKEL